MNDLPFKVLTIPDCWEISHNNFLDIEPDNDFPIDDVWYLFDQNILHATYNGFFIDLGFYGEYLDERKGFFKIHIVKGDFLNGILYEQFISRSTEEIKEKLNCYFALIPAGILGQVKGYEFSEDGTGTIDDFDLYSAINNISKKLTEKEIEEIAKPRT